MKITHLLGAVAALALATVTSVSVTQPAAAAASASQDDTINTTMGPLVIHPVHHGGLVLSWNNRRIVVDPTTYPPGPNSGAAAFRGPNPPDLILITHEHGDHFSVPTLTELAGPNTVIVAPQAVQAMMPPALQAKTRVMANGQSQTHAGVPIEAVPEYNITPDRLQFHPKGRDNGYVLSLGGQRVYIAGDTEGTPELRALQNIDIAFIPMILPYTQTPEAAADWVRAFRPKIVYPYHYGMQSSAEQFRTLVGNAAEVRLRNWYN